MKTRTLILMLALVSLAACTSPTPAAKVPIRICTSAVSGTQLPVWYAQEKGLFAKYGLESELLAMDGGVQAAALAAGEVDLCQGSPSASIAAAVAGADNVVIAGLVNRLPYALVVRPEIKDPAHLKGGAIAVNGLTGSAAVAGRQMLAHLGLKPDEDVAILAVGDQGARLAAMQTGAVLGTLVTPPQTLEAKEMGFHILLDTSQFDLPHQHTAITSSRAYLASHRADAVNAMKAITEALALIESDRAGAIAVMANYMALNPETDAASLEEAYDELVRKFFVDVPYPTLDGIQTELDALVVDNPDAARFAPKDLVDMSIIEELEKSGFIASLRS